MNKPAGWLPTKPSPQQMFMLGMFARAGNSACTIKPGSWCTYWALRRRGLVHARNLAETN